MKTKSFLFLILIGIISFLFNCGDSIETQEKSPSIKTGASNNGNRSAQWVDMMDGMQGVAGIDNMQQGRPGTFSTYGPYGNYGPYGVLNGYPLGNSGNGSEYPKGLGSSAWAEAASSPN